MTDWYYASQDNQQVGPVAGEQLVELFERGVITRETLVWREGLDNWLPLRRFFDELGLREAATASAAAVTVEEPAPAAEVHVRPPDIPAEAVTPRVSSPIHVPVMSVPPPRTGKSGCAIAAIVALILCVALGGLLAAIAIPAYKDFQHRVEITSALTSATAHQTAIAEFQQRNGSCPDNTSEGFKPAEDYAGTNIAAIKFGQFEGGNCGMEVKLRGDDIEGKFLWLEHAGDDWRCSSEIKDSLLPATCRRH